MRQLRRNAFSSVLMRVERLPSWGRKTAQVLQFAATRA